MNYELIKSASAVCIDSRAVIPNSIFVALQGTNVDGQTFIPAAIEKGASMIVCHHKPEKTFSNVTFVEVPDTTVALGEIAAIFYDKPSTKLKLVGITGTNGKTSTVSLLHDLMMGLGHKAGLISTVCNKIGETIYPSTHTTPDAVTLNKLLAQMVSEGCEYCFMEVSSHAIVQNRITGLQFTGGIFSNITHDHLDYHKTFDAYLKAKKQFFDNLPATAFAITNIDDRNGKIMIQNCQAHTYTYSLQSPADYKAKIIENTLEGLHLQLDGNNVWFRLVGKFNAYNLTAVYATAHLLGFAKEEILHILSGLTPPPGRFQTIPNNRNITALIDYAHTPDALSNVLNTIHEVCENNRTAASKPRIITVVGCGGNRDKSKRPEMAQIACQLSDQVIFTSDNPRNEDPYAILADMKENLPSALLAKSLTIENREEAIRTACALSHTGDIILVAGKGHETYQEIKGTRHHFDDSEILSQTLNPKY